MPNRSRKGKKNGRSTAMVVYQPPPPPVHRKKARKARARKRSGVMAELGSGIGSFLFGPTGSIIGRGLGSSIDHVFGHGAYRFRKNTLMGVGGRAILGNQVPMFGRDGDGFRVTHKEFLGDVVGSTAFTLNTYDINVGLGGTFPWLAQLAVNFEEYRLDGLIFAYKPTSGTAVSNTSAALGVVVMATNYDALDPVFTSKQAMESYEFATSCVPFSGMEHPVECAMGSDPLCTQYIRTGSIPAGADLRMYDKGFLCIATQGMQSAYTVGELWVTYDVVFKKPRIAPTADSGAYPYYAHVSESPVGSATAAHPFGTTFGVVSPSSDLTVLISTDSIVLPNIGTYLVSYTATTSSADIAAAPSLSLGSALTALNSFADNTSNLPRGFTSGAGFVNAVISVASTGTGAANALTVTGLTSMTAATADLWVSAVANVAKP